LALAENRFPDAWQTTHWVGVPRKTALTWQESQRARKWAPVRLKPVLIWSNRTCLGLFSAASALETVTKSMAAAQRIAMTTD
jgi:hypothetical protein